VGDDPLEWAYRRLVEEQAIVADKLRQTDEPYQVEYERGKRWALRKALQILDWSKLDSSVQAAEYAAQTVNDE
jgi:hypothetical protein